MKFKLSYRRHGEKEARKVKWYEYKKAGAIIWWTQRDANGKCYEIHRMHKADDEYFTVYQCEQRLPGKFASLIEAQKYVEEVIVR